MVIVSCICTVYTEISIDDLSMYIPRSTISPRYLTAREKGAEYATFTLLASAQSKNNVSTHTTRQRQPFQKDTAVLPLIEYQSLILMCRLCVAQRPCMRLSHVMASPRVTCKWYTQKWFAPKQDKSSRAGRKKHEELPRLRGRSRNDLSNAVVAKRN